jgi:hypothetical protein
MPGRAYVEGKEQTDDLTIIIGKLNNLAGDTPLSNVVIANWNSGVATSGNAGADLVTIGAAGVKKKVHSLVVSIRNLTVGATITIRMYMEVNGVEDEVYDQTYVQGVDPDGVWVIDGTVGIHEALRVEVYSNNAADDGAQVVYDYMTEAM